MESGQAAPLIELIDNHIWFHSHIDNSSALALIRALWETDLAIRQETIRFRHTFREPPVIWLHINSLGGDLLSSFALVDTIKALSTPVYSVIEGMAASGATLVSMACWKRYITANAFMLIHQLSGIVEGTHAQMNDGKELTDKLMEQLVSFYVDHSALKRKAIKRMLLHDYTMDSAEAIESGFADAFYEVR